MKVRGRAFKYKAFTPSPASPPTKSWGGEYSKNQIESFRNRNQIGDIDTVIDNSFLKKNWKEIYG
jgi:hypothetical protein